MRDFALSLSGGPHLSSFGQTANSFAGEGGEIPAVSSNGTRAGSAVAWATTRVAQGSNFNIYADDATNLQHMLFAGNAGQWLSGGDAFLTPTVAGDMSSCRARTRASRSSVCGNLSTEGRPRLARKASAMDAGFTVRLVAASAFIAIVLLGVRYVLPIVLRGRTAGTGGRLISVIESATLATNTGVHLVRIADRFFLVGGGDGHLSLLAELTADSVAARIERRGEAMTVSRGPIVDWLEKTIRPQPQAGPSDQPDGFKVE